MCACVGAFIRVQSCDFCLMLSFSKSTSSIFLTPLCVNMITGCFCKFSMYNSHDHSRYKSRQPYRYTVLVRLKNDFNVILGNEKGDMLCTWKSYYKPIISNGNHSQWLTGNVISKWKGLLKLANAQRLLYQRADAFGLTNQLGRSWIEALEIVYFVWRALRRKLLRRGCFSPYSGLRPAWISAT